MKKTLVALAVLAASGASFAQATITGNYTAGFVSTTNAAGLTTAGLGTDTANLQFNASEDIGGGLKASAKVSLGGAARGSSVGGEDAFVQLEGGFGKVKLGAMESGQNYDVATPGGSIGFGLDGKVLGANVTSDSATYSLPAFGALVVSVGYGDYNSTPTPTAGAAGAGGADANVLSQSSVNIAAAYTAGGLTVAGKYLAYRNQDLESATGGNNVQKSRYLARISYNFGFADVGLGLASTTYANTDASQQYQLGASAPLGALTLGAKYAVNKDFTSGAIDKTSADSLVKRSGYTLSADYALSKRTVIGGSLYNWSSDAAAGNNTGYQLLLAHSF